MVSLRQLLEIVHPVSQRVMIVLHDAIAQHVENDLRILGIVLVPRVMQRLTGAGQCQTGNQMQLKSVGKQEMSEATMVIARGLESDVHRPVQRMQVLGETSELAGIVGDDHALARAPAGRFDEDIVAELGNVDGYQYVRLRRTLLHGHGWFALLSG
jgi:hypothetical protein